MSAAAGMAIVALLTAIFALIVSIRSWRRLLATQALLARAEAALDEERQATSDSIAAAHRSTVEEVTALLENVLTQVDTDITAKVAEALAVLNLCSTPGVGGADENLTGTSTREPSEAELQNPPADVPAD